MELKLYNRLRTDFLKTLAAASERHDPAYQKAVEGYAPAAESGVAKWARDAIQGWLARYNALVSRPVQLRYYQILALYFTEAALRERRDGKAEAPGNLLAYWMATGSGKTLLMHLNILQYIDHIGGMQAFDELQIIVTTPGVNLIEQHRRDLLPLVGALNRQCANRIRLTVESTGSLLNHERGYFKLPPSSRVFRLVLVDEGHIGLAGGGKEAGAFKQLRHELADFPNAFLFEYSATYHGISEKHVEEYGGQIVYDYNYFRFYKDGYGKDYSIHRVGADAIAVGEEAWENFQAAFETLADKLTLHDELRLSEGGSLGFTAQFADKPLIAFMGNTVEDKKKEGKGGDDEVSDIRKLLAFLAKLSPAGRARLAPVFNGQVEGVLTLTRCAAVADEIYLSWGDSGYWGIVNVGNGDKFFNDSDGHPELKDAAGQPLVRLAKAPIVEKRFQFSDMDLPASPINVLVGSRKFAEGWNCFRVSVIGLVNLGSSKGNKIIQIFGRGVRLKGLKADGKRKSIDHVADYAALVESDSPDDRLRQLETLNIFSLKATYLETFLKALDRELPSFVVERRVQVEAQTLKLGKTREAFAAYAEKLPVFKVGREDTEPRLQAVLQANNRWRWAYFDGAEETTGELSRCVIQLDYRPDALAESHNLAQNLRNSWAGAALAFAAGADLQRRMETLVRGRAMQLLREVSGGAGGCRLLSPGDLLDCVNGVDYHREWADVGFAHREELLWQTVSDAVAQLHHKLIYDINKRRYRFDEPLRQSEAGQPGDFIDHYDVRIEFEKKDQLEEFERTYPQKEFPEQLCLELNESRHIYAPLLKDGADKAVSALKFKSIAISPDALNPGERKFVEDLHVFLGNPVNQGRLKGFDFYLMRNVESLRSVGVYLDTETRAYFPDFVLWVVGKKCTHILLVDPKGQSGIYDLNSLNTPNAKVKLATNGDLVELTNRLTTLVGKKFQVDSFILLRKSSPLGRANGSFYDDKEVALMVKDNVYHLNWGPARDEVYLDEDGELVTQPPEGCCYVERMLYRAGVLQERSWPASTV